MKVLIGISHPKQVYMFKNLIYSLKQNNHSVFVVVTEKEITCELLKKMNIKFQKIGENKKNILSKIFQIFILTYKTFVISIAFNPDIYISQALPHFAYSSFLLRKKYIIFEDTENSRWLQKIVNPFAKSIITPKCFQNNLGPKQIKINGSFELAYLSMNSFKPDVKILKKAGINKDEKYAIIRFVDWKAHHDIGHSGLSLSNKIKAVKEFSKFGKVFISSEAKLPKELKKYEIKISPDKIHQLLYFADLVYGESATMAAESAVLGTPAIYLDNEGRGYTDELENKYGLVFNFSESENDQILSIEKGKEILNGTYLKNEWKIRRIKMLRERVDVNNFMIWFIENYPYSHGIIKKNPEYLNKFTF
jgi:hypothetical protein